MTVIQVDLDPSGSAFRVVADKCCTYTQSETLSDLPFMVQHAGCTYLPQVYKRGKICKQRDIIVALSGCTCGHFVSKAIGSKVFNTIEEFKVEFEKLSKDYFLKAGISGSRIHAPDLTEYWRFFYVSPTQVFEAMYQTIWLTSEDKYSFKTEVTIHTDAIKAGGARTIGSGSFALQKLHEHLSFEEQLKPSDAALREMVRWVQLIEPTAGLGCDIRKIRFPNRFT